MDINMYPITAPSRLISRKHLIRSNGFFFMISFSSWGYLQGLFILSWNMLRLPRFLSASMVISSVSPKVSVGFGKEIYYLPISSLFARSTPLDY
jgi:hypothetical protein